MPSQARPTPWAFRASSGRAFPPPACRRAGAARSRSTPSPVVMWRRRRRPGSCSCCGTPRARERRAPSRFIDVGAVAAGEPLPQSLRFRLAGGRRQARRSPPARLFFTPSGRGQALGFAPRCDRSEEALWSGGSEGGVEGSQPAPSRRSPGIFLPRDGGLADSVHARLAGITPASAHPVDAVLASVRTAQTVTGTARTALARPAVVKAALRRAGLTDRVAERPAGARLAGQALTAIAVIRAGAGKTGLARGTGAHAGSTHAAGKTLGVVAGALADSGHAGLAQGRIAGTAASVHTRLAGAAS